MKLFWHNTETENTGKLNYSNLLEKELLDSFKSENWAGLDEEQRIAIVQELENRNAAAQGREPAVVVSMDDGQRYGQYNASNGQLSIDVMNFSSYETLDTYVHESNHAYQAYCVQTGQGYDEQTLGMIQAEMARDERGFLYNYATEPPEYDIQCDELDSNNKAAVFLVSQKERYQNDPEYCAYIKERAEHFEYVNNSLHQDREQRVAMQNRQAHLAYVRGDVSEEQYHTLSQNINNEQYTDAAAAESYSVGEAVSEINHEFRQNYAENSYLGSVSENTMGSQEEAMFDYTGSVGYSVGGLSLDTNDDGMENDHSMDIG